jgi:hypothetical protein
MFISDNLRGEKSLIATSMLPNLLTDFVGVASTEEARLSGGQNTGGPTYPH